MVNKTQKQPSLNRLYKSRAVPKGLNKYDLYFEYVHVRDKDGLSDKEAKEHIETIWN